MSNKRKRGAARCLRGLDSPEDYVIDFNANGQAIGPKRKVFKSWVGIEFRSRIPYYKLVNEINKQLYDDVWEYIKRTWSIPNNELIKNNIVKEGKEKMRSFRHTLRNDFALKDISPFKKFSYMDRKHWDSFAKAAKTEAFKLISEKAKQSAKENIDRARVGRLGFAGLMEVWEERWDELAKSYPHLGHMKDERSKIYTVSRAHYNPVTEKYELGPHLLSEGVLTGRLQELHCKEKEMMANGTYYEPRKDVVTEVIGKGRQHGGRTRLVSNVIGATQCLFSEDQKKKRTKKAEKVRAEIDAMQGDQLRVSAAAEASSSGCVLNDLPDIESITKCELVCPFNKEDPNTVLARGRVYPTSDRTLHHCTIADGFVKVQVDLVIQKYKDSIIPHETQTDELNTMGDAQGQFIQWPRKSIKLIDTTSRPLMIAQDQRVSLLTPPSPHSITADPPQHSFSPSYRPQFDETYQDQQTMTLQDEALISRQPDISFIDMLDESYLFQSTNVDSNHVERVNHVDTKAVTIENENIASLLVEVREKPGNMYIVAEKLACVSNSILEIEAKSPHGMYNDDFGESVLIEDLIGLCLNRWMDASILSWFAMYLYNANGQTAYFNPRYIDLNMCKINKKLVKSHIHGVMKLHKNKQYFMAPYLAGDHWSLILVTRRRNTLYSGAIIDSHRKGKDKKSYVITKLIEEVIGEMIDWEMVNCYQQKDKWESGYYVMKAMYDFVNVFHEHLTMCDSRAIEQAAIDVYIEHALHQFVTEFEL